jgi:hypothetical protein
MPSKKILVELGKKALKAYDDADRPLGQALSLLKGRSLRPPKPQKEVDAGIGCAIWRVASGLRGLTVPEPSADVLARIGSPARRYIDSADLGHVGGEVDDVHWGIGRRVMIAYDEEVRRLAVSDIADPEALTPSGMSRP